MKSEMRLLFCKYWNLHAVVMSDCSLIATRKSHAKHNKSVGRIPERGQTRHLNFSASTSGNKKRKSVCWRGTYDLFRWKQSMNSKPHAHKHKLVTFLIPEHRQGRVARQSHKMRSVRRQLFGENCNLHAVVMPDCSLIATRKSHAKHKKSVGRIPRGAERGQTRLLNFSASTSGNKKRKSVGWRGTYELFRCKQPMYSKSHANKHKLVTFLIPERG